MNPTGFLPSGFEDLDRIDRDILHYFQTYQERHNRPPTVREVLRAVRGLNSTSSVKYRLDRLVERGILRRYTGDGRSSRSYYLPLQGEEIPPETGGLIVPVLGYITASGQETRVFIEDMPASSIQQVMARSVDPGEVEDVVTLDGLEGLYFDARRYFALRVKGTSMQDRHIFDGDVVIFKRIEEAPTSAKLVAVLVDDWLTLKEYRGLQDGQVVLHPANREEGLQPIHVPADKVRFEGEAVMVLRPLK